MAKRPNRPTARLSLNQAENIPLDKLVISEANVRAVGADDAASIRAMADSLARRSLLQSLMVRPALDPSGEPTGMYDVTGGGRRLRALQLLVTQKRLAADAPIPCIVKTDGHAVADSLAENSDREDLHPLDQFRAFAALRASGQSDEDIAAAFAVTPAVVRQRLRLADASPVLLAAYEANEIALDVLMAFCVTTDAARQEQVYASLADGELSAWSVRRRLTDQTVPSHDRRVRFVGLETYVQAGGTVMSDLFSKEGDAYIQDIALLDRLVAEKLSALRDRVLAAGWSWCLAALEMPWSELQDYASVKPVGDGITPKMARRLERLIEAHDALAETDAEELPAEHHEKLLTLEAEIADIQNTPPVFAPEDMAKGGVLIRVDASGQPTYRWGAVKREAKAAVAVASNGAAATGSSADDSATTSDRIPESLARDLTAFWTAGLRDALANNYEIAFVALLHAMAVRCFHDFATGMSCLQVTATAGFRPTAAGIADFPALLATQQRHQMWARRLPNGKDDLWNALLAMSIHDRQLLLAHCVGLTLDGVTGRPDKPSTSFLHSHAVADALGFTIQQAGWITGVDNYLGRVTKTRILAAVTEAKGEQTAQLLGHLKKDDMAKEAQRLLTDTSWVPEVLRSLELPALMAVDGEDGEDAVSTDGDELPGYLTDPDEPDGEEVPAPDA